MANRLRKQERRSRRGMPEVAGSPPPAAERPSLRRDGVQALRSAEIGPAGVNQCGNLLLVLNRKKCGNLPSFCAPREPVPTGSL